MVPMYLGRWIVFYMDINGQYAGTNRRKRKFKDEAHNEEIPNKCVNYKSISPSRRFVVSRGPKPFVCEVHGHPKPFENCKC